MRFFKSLPITGKAGVYVLKNILDNSIYVGHASNLRLRKNAHYTRLNNNQHSNKHLQNAFNLYGRENFKFYAIEYCECDKQILARVETYWVNVLNPEYNIRMVVESNLGLKKSAEDVEKTASKLRGIKRSQWIRDRISKALTGRKRPIEVIKKIALKLKGKENLLMQKSVLQYDLNGQFVARWKSVTEASRAFGSKGSVVSSACTAKAKSVFNYLWFHEVGFTEQLLRERVISKNTRLQYVRVKCTPNKTEQPVVQLNVDDLYVHTYKSIADAQRQTGTNGIVRCCKESHRTANGFRWKYFLDYCNSVRA